MKPHWTQVAGVTILLGLGAYGLAHHHSEPYDSGPACKTFLAAEDQASKGIINDAELRSQFKVMYAQSEKALPAVRDAAQRLLADTTSESTYAIGADAAEMTAGCSAGH